MEEMVRVQSKANNKYKFTVVDRLIYKDIPNALRDFDLFTYFFSILE
jgi:hypothetical protein